MKTNWKYSADGLTASRTLDTGWLESRLVSEIPANELAGAQPADPVPVVIPELTPRQVRLALNAAGLRTAVEAAVAVADQNTKDMWEFSSVFKRDDAVLIAMATALGITSTQLDELFIAGAKL